MSIPTFVDGQVLTAEELNSAFAFLNFPQVVDEFLGNPNLSVLIYALSKKVQPGTEVGAFLNGSRQPKSVSTLSGNDQSGYVITLHLDPDIADISYFQTLQLVYSGA